MPNIKSAKKRILVSARRKEENTLVNSSMKTAVKNVEKAVKENDKEKASENLKIAEKRIDKAVGSKSRLTKSVNTME